MGKPMTGNMHKNGGRISIGLGPSNPVTWQ